LEEEEEDGEDGGAVGTLLPWEAVCAGVGSTVGAALGDTTLSSWTFFPLCFFGVLWDLVLREDEDAMGVRSVMVV